MVFQQRNGRVDRYGQTATPSIVYLVTESINPTIRGDTRILEVLMEKDGQAYKNIGDPSVFMDVHDIDEEEDFTKLAIASGESATDFEGRLDGNLAAEPSGRRGPARDVPESGWHGTRGRAGYHAAATALPVPKRARLLRGRLASSPGRGHGSLPTAMAVLPPSRSRLRFRVDADSETLTLDAPDDLVAQIQLSSAGCPPGQPPASS